MVAKTGFPHTRRSRSSPRASRAGLRRWSCAGKASPESRRVAGRRRSWPPPLRCRRRCGSCRPRARPAAACWGGTALGRRQGQRPLGSVPWRAHWGCDWPMACRARGIPKQTAHSEGIGCGGDPSMGLGVCGCPNGRSHRRGCSTALAPGCCGVVDGSAVHCVAELSCPHHSPTWREML